MSDKEKRSAETRSGASHRNAKEAAGSSHASGSAQAAAAPSDSNIPDTVAEETGGSAAATIRELEQEVKRAHDQYVRALAEFENTKKRLHREKEEFAKYAAKTVLRDLLPIIDSLDQALVAVDKQADPQAIIKGVHLIYRQLLGLLQKEGVARIPTVGELFDPHQHEAVAQVEVDDDTQDGTVISEVQVGYTMHGQVLRPAMVKVTKSKATDQQSTTNESEPTTNIQDEREASS